jgi:hypothetical protein
VPEGQRPAGLIRTVTGEGDHGAVDQGGQGRNFGGKVQQGSPALPVASGDQPQGATMVDGAVEIVRLIPTGQAAIQGQPEAIAGRGQKPNSGQASPPKSWGKRTVASLDDRLGGCERCQGDRGRIGSVCLAACWLGTKVLARVGWVFLNTDLCAPGLPFAFLSQQRHWPSEELAKCLRRIAPCRVRTTP